MQGRGIFFWYQAIAVAKAEASCRYRIGHLVEVLPGARSIIAEAPALAAFDGARVVVVLRPLLDSRARHIVLELRARGVVVLADFDDLLFGGSPHQAPLVLGGRMSAAAWRERTEHYRAGLGAFDALMGATHPLVRALEEVGTGKPVFHMPNGLSPGWLRQGDCLSRRRDAVSPRVLRYFPGSPSHDADLAMIQPELCDFLEAHPTVQFEVIGQAALLDGWPARVRKLDPVPFAELPGLLASSWVTLAPLYDSEFSRAKSAIKFLESAAFGVPCVASPLEDLEPFAGGGAVVASTAPDFRVCLEELLTESRREEVSRVAERTVRRVGMAARSGQALLHAVSTLGVPLSDLPPLGGPG